MPTRQDFQRLVEWCDREPPFGWLKNVAGVALAVHSVTPIGTPDPPATGLWTGDLALREVPGISELPEEPVHFVGTLVGVRNPARQAQLSITARVDQAVAKLSGDGIPAAWNSGFEIEHVRDEFGCSRLTGRSGTMASPTCQRGSTFLKCLSCCSGLRFVRTSISAPPDTKREPRAGRESRASGCVQGEAHRPGPWETRETQRNSSPPASSTCPHSCPGPARQTDSCPGPARQTGFRGRGYPAE
jgi:hypothetical protein